MGWMNKLKVVVWNIGFIENDFSSIIDKDNFKIKWMQHKYKDRFFADPFLLSEDEYSYTVLAEEYLFVEAKGKIVKLVVDKKNKELLKRELLLETEYHLSYPFIDDKCLYPEQNASGKWKKYNKNGVEISICADLPLIDATIFNDGVEKWIFASKIEEDKIDSNRKLFRYRLCEGRVDSDSEILIKDNFKGARPGGAFFKYKGKWYRPAQVSSENVYGEAIQIYEVLDCSLTGYREKLIYTITSNKEERFNKGLHTFNVYDDVIIVDGFEMQTHPIQKIKNKLLYL